MPILLVVHPFGDHQKGDQIDDAATMAAILGGVDADKVVQTAAPSVTPPPSAAHDPN